MKKNSFPSWRACCSPSPTTSSPRTPPPTAPNLTLGSLDKDLRKNADGTVDLYFGPKAPAGQESNWIYTQAGKKWFPWFRVYGPEKGIFDKSFKLPDIELVK